MDGTQVLVQALVGGADGKRQGRAVSSSRIPMRGIRRGPGRRSSSSCSSRRSPTTSPSARLGRGADPVLARSTLARPRGAAWRSAPARSRAGPASVSASVRPGQRARVATGRSPIPAPAPAAAPGGISPRRSSHGLTPARRVAGLPRSALLLALAHQAPHTPGVAHDRPGCGPPFLRHATSEAPQPVAFSARVADLRAVPPRPGAG